MKWESFFLGVLATVMAIIAGGMLVDIVSANVREAVSAEIDEQLEKRGLGK